MHDSDDLPVGRLLSRREALTALGVTGVTLATGCAPSPRSDAGATTTASVAGGTAALSCVVRPEQTEGPYFVDGVLNRSDIRADPADGSVRQGAPLELSLYVSRVNGSACTPLAGAVVDVWQCDADGVYSDVVDPQFDTRGKKYLRGYQVTDADGLARFTTIYPGWYRGRTVHIHFKVRTRQGAPAQEFTSQLYFDDALTDRVLANAPYSGRGQRTTRNAGDGIYRRSGGDQLMLDVREVSAGYAADFRIGLQV